MRFFAKKISLNYIMLSKIIKIFHVYKVGLENDITNFFFQVGNINSKSAD